MTSPEIEFATLAILIDKMVLSPKGSLSSSAMTTQLAIMVIMMVHSKTGQLTNHVVRRRTGLDGVKRKRDVGPVSATPSFFFRLIWQRALVGRQDAAGRFRRPPLAALRRRPPRLRLLCA